MKTGKSVLAIMVQVFFISSILFSFSGAAGGACISFTFEKQEPTPLTGVSVGTKNIISTSVADIDGKNGPDVVVTSGQNGLLYIIKNNGTSDPFEPPVTNYNLGIGANYITAGFTDVNGDNLPDLFVSVGYPSSLKTLRYFENTTTADGTINFEEKTGDPANPFKDVEIYETATFYGFPMSFGNLNGDKKNAIFGIESSNIRNNIIFFQKEGDRFVRQNENPFFCISSSGWAAAPDLRDIDKDGDLDLIVGFKKHLRFYENTGTAQLPRFAVDAEGTCIDNSCPVAESSSEKYFSPAFADFDGDGILAGVLTSAVEFEYWKVSYSNKIPGDIDGKNGPTLADAILGLKILAGADISGETVNLNADINADQMIGQEEVIFVLREVAQIE